MTGYADGFPERPLVPPQIRGRVVPTQPFLPGFGDDALPGPRFGPDSDPGPGPAPAPAPGPGLGDGYAGAARQRHVDAPAAGLREIRSSAGLCPEDLRTLLEVPFTDEQLAVAAAPMEPSVVVAGAGSGKTSVMAARVVWLVATGAVAPERVLGLTFTTKAAAELAGRIRAALGRFRAGWAANPGGGGSRAAPQVDPMANPMADPPTGSHGVPADLADDSADPVVCTYHAYAGRLVTEHALRLGLEPDARVLAAPARYQLAARVVRGHTGHIEAITKQTSAVVGDVVALDGEMSEHLLTPERLAAFDRAWLAEVEAMIAEAAGRCGTKGRRAELRRIAAATRTRIELAAFVADYRRARRERDVVDFGDQVRLAARLAETMPEVGAAERERAGVVLLDEYQDTSVAQRRMLAGLFGGGHPVTAVGDPCQAIYGWRGASVANLDRFPEHFPRADGTEATVDELSVNQRSGGQLLRLANGVAAPLRARHRLVELQPRPEVVAAGRTVVALHPTWVDEVTWVARRLRGLVADGVAPGQCAVLVRARADVAPLYAALLAEGLPVEVVGLGGLLALPEVADVVAVCEVLDDPTANGALVRLLTGPRVRLGARDLAALGRRARQLVRDATATGTGGATAIDATIPVTATTTPDTPAPGAPPAGRAQEGTRRTTRREIPGAARGDALVESVSGVDPVDVVSLCDALADPGEELSAQAAVRVRALAAELSHLRAHVGDGLVDLMRRVVATIGLDTELAASPEAVASHRRDNLAAFLDIAADYDDPDGASSLTSFLGYLRAAAEHERGLDVVGPTGSDAVQLMTVHKSKGLEWDVVAVPNLSRDVFPDTRVRAVWTTSAAVVPTPLRGDADELPAFSLGGGRKASVVFAADMKDYLEREERRLAYVAFTRARSVLLGSGHWWGPTQKKPRGASPFLTELYEHARAGGGGDVDVWAPKPGESANPALAEANRYDWPAPYSPATFARRKEAAGAVRAYLAALAVGGVLPADAADGGDVGGFDGIGGFGGVDGFGRFDGGDVDGGDVDGGGAGVLTARERALLAELDRDAALLLDEERAARRPSREVELPRGLSASQVVVLRTDPATLARELARPLPRRPVPQARRGTRFHAWVEEIFQARPLLDPDDLPGAADAEFDDTDLAELQAAFLAGPYGARRPFAVEEPFELALAGRVLRGRIDAVYDLGGGRWDVVDWKTGHSGDAVQLAVYRLAWARRRGVDPANVGAAFLYVRTGEVARPPLLSEADLAAILT